MQQEADSIKLRTIYQNNRITLQYKHPHSVDWCIESLHMGKREKRKIEGFV